MRKFLATSYGAMVLITILFLLAIALNLSPYLRGPAPYYPDWRWPYMFSNTLSRLWAPLIVIIIILLVAYNTERMNVKTIKRATPVILLGTIILGFLMQLALLYYSRAGLNVLIERIIYPSMSGYFTASLTISSIPVFLHNFTANVHLYPMYAQFHPPGSILLFTFITYLISPLAVLFPKLSHVTPNHKDIAVIWQHLTRTQQLSAIVSGLLIPFLTSLTVLPLYFCARYLYGERVGIRSIFTFLLIPNALMFIPLNDAFLPLCTCLFLYPFMRGMLENKKVFLLVSGVFFCLGVSLTLSYLPVIVFLLSLSIYKHFMQPKIFTIKRSVSTFAYVTIGFILIPLIIFLLYGLNPVTMTTTIMHLHLSDQTGRHFYVWVFYNLYDFFLFFGIPLSFLYGKMISGAIEQLRAKKISQKHLEWVFVCATVFIFLLDISDTVKGETARIWIPYIPIFLLPIINYITTGYIFTRLQFIVLLLLLAVQVVVFQSVLVTVW